MYYLYILRCADQTFYTGITVELLRRVNEHNDSALGARYTRGRRPVELVFSKKFPNRSSALKEEFRIKRLSREQKLKIISEANPDF
jgi:putative endonuclease